MKYFLLSCISLLLLGCNLNDKKAETKQSNDLRKSSLQVREEMKSKYDQKERNALDSIKKYKLESLFMTCLKSFYQFHGSDSIYDYESGGFFTVGEFDVKIVDFKVKDQVHRTIEVDLFKSDSLPVLHDGRIKNGGGKLNSFFEIDILNNSLLSVSTGGPGEIKGEAFLKASIQISNTEQFKNYINDNRVNLSPRFKSSIMMNR